MGLRVLVCGGRHYENRDLVYRCLDRLHKFDGVSLVIHGAARGADTLAGEWAEERGVPVEDYPIQPGEGGFARNGRMLAISDPDLVVFFPGGRGTRDMKARAYACQIPRLPGLDVENVQGKLL